MPETDYTLVDSLSALCDAFCQIQQELAEDPLLAIDTETYQALAVPQPYGFADPHTHKVRLIQLRTRHGSPVILDLAALAPCADALDLVRELLTLPDVTYLGYNLKFDLKMLFGTLGVWLPKVYDLMVSVYLIGYATGISAYRNRGMGLKDAVRDYLDIQLDKGMQATVWSGKLSDEQLAYAAEDVVHLHDLHGILHQALLDEYACPQTEALEMAVLPYVAEIEYYGIGFDRKLFTFIQQCGQRHLPQLSETLGTYFKVPMQQSLDPVTQAYIQVPLINWDSNLQVLQLFQNHGIEVENLEYETIDAAAKTHEILYTYQDYKAISKQLSTPLGDWVHPLTGRIHGELNQNGTATGRFSASDPNLQQVPKVDIAIPADLIDETAHARFYDKKKQQYLVNYRYCFIPKTGNVLLSCDYSSQELAIMAVESGDANMQAVLNRPEKIQVEKDGVMVEIDNPEADMHAINCERAFGIPKERAREKHPTISGKTWRDLAKAVSFGSAYGQTAAAFAALWGIPKTEAESILDAILGAMPSLKKWLKQVGKLGETTHLSRFGLDRVRFLNDSNHGDKGAIKRAAGNTPIQGAGSQMIKTALLYLGPKFRELREQGQDAYLMYAVHDEVLAEGPQPQLDELKDLIVTQMNASSHVFLKGVVPDRASCAYGDHWKK